jgi:spore maturation protein CgeB
MSSPLRILYAYPDFVSASYEESNAVYAKRYVERLRAAGYQVTPFCLTLSPPGPALTWPELQARWTTGDRVLMEMYARLDHALQDSDVLLNAAGINLHPEYLKTVDAFTAFQCFDDPENSKNLSQPVAHAYDLCLVGNAAEVKTYESWGARRSVWSPMGAMPGFWDPTMTRKQVENREARDIDVLVIADFNYPTRRKRLQELVNLIPTGRFYGPGAPHGFLPQSEFLPTLRRTKIGLNVHNSTGPINHRTFYLPANGVMQICDNSSFLGTAFEIGNEVIAADSTREMTSAVAKYLADPKAQRDIAVAGWDRARTCYTEHAVFARILDAISLGMADPNCTRQARIRAIEANATNLRDVTMPEARRILRQARLSRNRSQLASWIRSR